ncbi:GNAT family N-acyltransferase [Paraglaciecola hydrolytica]|uniref:L-ornithine N(alpha)-acyltransferase n=1 Tax=Paraglaciecola hydrolytica TaxID=1799789 RepID=A0A148KMH3_9ALTE|nr:GNAT family N-acyltransferase [Paraglaciecola hydrolytica]KXI27490.1 acyltransferase [Paraglaciecola hydrolytica]
MFTVDEVLLKHYPNIANKPLLSKSLTFLLRRLLHEREMHEFATLYPHLRGLDFVEQVLDYFKISYSVRDVEKEHIPNEGRVVIIANHPIGSLDALALIKLVSEVRKDIKVIANQLLMALPPLHPLLLPVNNMQGGTAKEHIKSIQQHLEHEGVVIVFPAGEVSRLRPQGIRDTKWQSGFLRIAKQTKSAILPVYIDAKNSTLFYSLSMLYKPLASMLLVTEMFKQQRKHLPIRIGELIPYSSFATSNLAKKLQVSQFKKHLYKIGNNKPGIFITQKPIAMPENRQELKQALKRHCQRLGETADGKIIYLYQHAESTAILREIGRLREIAFRAVGEGTNKKRDIDHYDQDYFQLILWDPEELEIAGAYRFGDAKNLIAKNGLKGIYSSTLFDYSPAMNKYFEQGLELGRSFVQPKYWGKRSLDYLWYGIGAFLQHHPQYRYLFGPVSLSNSYPQAAKELLVNFYTLYFKQSAPVATSKHPYLCHLHKEFFSGEDYQQDFSLLKKLLTNMGVAVPTLYKQYTETYDEGGVHFIDFNIDPDFNDCIDGLVIGDISMLKAKKRARYMPNAPAVEPQ